MNHDVLNDSATQILYQEADNILQILNNQDTLCLSCPIIEEVIDTKMYGFSEKVNFAIELGVVEKDEGNQLLSKLERDISVFYDKISKQ